MEELRKIPEQFSINNLCFRLIKRTEKTALYEAKTPDGHAAGYEVHKIRIKKPSKHTFPGGRVVNYPLREVLASNEQFGTWATSWRTLEQAENAFKTA